jgi:hypothetical protein
MLTCLAALVVTGCSVTNPLKPESPSLMAGLYSGPVSIIADNVETMSDGRVATGSPTAHFANGAVLEADRIAVTGDHTGKRHLHADGSPVLTSANHGSTLNCANLKVMIELDRKVTFEQRGTANKTNGH